MDTNQVDESKVKELLIKHHKRGGLIAENPDQLAAWIADVEQHVADGNGSYFEIKAADSISGYAVVCDV